MEFKIKTTELVRELNLVQGVVEKRTTIPILSNVLIEAEAGRVVLTATDLELGIRSVCTAEVIREGAGTLPARRLLDYVRLLPDVEVSFKLLENQWAAVSCGRARTKIAGMSRESFPELPAMPGPTAEIPLDVLLGMTNRTGFAISPEESRFTLNGALLVLREGGAVMVATDGHRLAHVEADMSVAGLRGTQRVLVPKKAMVELVRLGHEAAVKAVQFSSDENHLYFQFGERVLIARKLTGSFPDYERVLPKEAKIVVTVNREEVRAAIERVSKFADERSHAIRIQLNPGEISFYSSTSEAGESEEAVPADYDGTAFEIGFNAGYILDFLRATSGTNVLLRLKDSHSAAEMRPADEEAPYRYRYVLMPMRI